MRERDKAIDFALWGVMVIVTLVVFAVFASGCTMMSYPKFLDDPDVKAAAIKAFEEGAKSFAAETECFDPGVEFFYKIGVGMQTSGVRSIATFQADAGETK